MNPHLHLAPALYTALIAPALTQAGRSVSVYSYLDKPDNNHYVLVQQPTTVEAAGATGCRAWECTTLVDVVTQFPAGKLSNIPANELVDQITRRLSGVALPLPAGWQCGIGRLQLDSELRESDGETRAIRRLLRYRWDVYYAAPVAAAPIF